MTTFAKIPRIALIAHDAQKNKIVEIATQFKATLTQCILCGTGTTAGRIKNDVGLPIQALLSGSLGGDQQIGAMVAEGRLDAIIFLRDSLCAQSHEPDINAFLRVCDVHMVAFGYHGESSDAFHFQKLKPAQKTALLSSKHLLFYPIV